MGFDNSDIKQKLALRNQVFNFDINTNEVIEYFAGEGQMTKFWQNISEKITCIDTDLKKLELIKSENLTLINGDNKNYLHLSKNVELIDCDSYGLVLDFVKDILEISETNKLIFFTDGSPRYFKSLKLKKNDFEDKIKALKPTQYHYEHSNQGNVYYGFIYKKL